MRVGITAFVTDRSLTPSELARAAEERGFHALYLPEHTHLPAGEAEPPALVSGVEIDDYRRTLDPFVALATAAAVTSRIALGTGICLVAQHDPIVLAKQIATLDHLSGGRFVLGMGYGWNRQEAADHGVAFDQRRQIAHEKLRCMRALWDAERAEFHGRFVELPPAYAWPKPKQPPPVLIGAAAGPRLFAAVAEHADGWMPIGGAGLGDAVEQLRQAWSDAGRVEAPEVVPFGAIPTEGKLEHFHAVGVTEVVLRIPVGTSSDVYRTLDDYARFVTGD
ncbi:MAG TPA: TIGR03619 family F420-dependent LLM class oxidoreductase [Acidimicrobiales bacterium]|nr:TIGR03619 family F420-dependent LLM class oxidoreductase [Acidimicrobiales bacterium]